MLDVPAEKLAELLGVSPSMVNRWILRVVVGGMKNGGSGVRRFRSSGGTILVEFDSIPRLIEGHHLNVDLEYLRAFIVEYDAEPYFVEQGEAFPAW